MRPCPSSSAASASVLPPAPAHASTTFPRGGGATASATSWLPSSITSRRPSWNAGKPKAFTRVSSTRPAAASDVGRVVKPSPASRAASASRAMTAVFARTVIGARWLSASASAAAPASPSSFTKRS